MSLNRYKARLVANGHSQQQGIDCDETYSPVVKPATIRTVLSLAVSRQWPIHQSDVMNAFLHGHLTETVYMQQPPGFTDSAHFDYVCLLQKSLYGLKQAPKLGFNDFLDMTPVDTEKKLGPERSPVTNPTLYRNLAGSLQYLTFTQPDLSYAVQQLCLYMHDPREPHLNAMKRVLRYLRGTIDLRLHLFRSTTSQLIAYSDADWAGCPATCRSTSGYCVFLGDNLLTWSSKRQDTLSHSSAEAEYRGVANAVAKTSWIRKHKRTKHIEIDIHFVRDIVAAGRVRVFHVPSRFQYADIFIKSIPYPLFADFRSCLSVRKTLASNCGGVLEYILYLM
nr:ribonuclease H-like domain-containing protein [Tanacetum cinerariifolium]